MSSFDHYIEKILDRVECEKDEREDMREEIRCHLMLAMEEYREQGYTKQEAVQRAIADFGVEEAIGEGLQRSLFPYRKEFLTCIGVGTIVYSASGYLYQLLAYGSAHPIWLTVSVLIGTCLVLAGMYPAYLADRKIVLGSMLALTCFCAVFGFTVVAGAEAWYVRILYVLGWFLAVFSLLMIFLTAIKGVGTGQESPEERKARIVIHVFNLANGIAVFACAAILAYAGLVFGGVSLFLLIPFSIVLFWAVSYWTQYRMRTRRIAVSYLFGSFSLMLTGGIVYMFSGTFG